MTRRSSVARLGSFVTSRALRIESLEDRRLLALVPELVADMNQFVPESDASELTALNGSVFFAYTDAAHGRELWTSDGTASGTRLVRDVIPGASSSAPRELTVVGDTLFFVAGTYPSVGLWKSDGTEDGTQRLLQTDFSSQLTASGGRLYFASTVGNDEELWTSDGTPTGTRMVANINPSDSSRPRNLVDVGGTLYFSAQTYSEGDEVFRTDGTVRGTQRITNMQWPSVYALTQFRDELYYFSGTNSPVDLGLWKVTGDSYQLLSGTDSYRIIDATAATNNALYFSDVSTGLFRYSPTGSVRIGSSARSLISAGENAYFTSHFDNGVWAANASSTQKVSALQPTAMAASGNGLFFLAYPRQLWHTDGTVQGTVLVKDLGAGGFEPRNLLEANGAVFFTANVDGGEPELWRSEGTADGTQAIATLAPQRTAGSQLTGLTPLGDRLLFFTSPDCCSSQPSLWSTDGSSLGTIPVYAGINIDEGSNFDELPVIAPGVVFFPGDSAVNPTGIEPWRTDGTPAGTALVKDINDGYDCGEYDCYPSPSGPRYMAGMGNLLFFSADDGLQGRELWRSDGTSAGTAIVQDIDPGVTNQCYYDPYSYEYVCDDVPNSSDPTSLTVFDNKLYFIADDDGSGRKLWRSDGTLDGTTIVKRFPSDGGTGAFGDLFELAGQLLFVANVGASGAELWRTDGTDAGTTLLRDVRPGVNSSSPSLLTRVGSRLFFTADDGIHGVELWTSDGTADGTRMVADLHAGAATTEIANLAGAGDDLYFAANVGNSGGELWKSDGTAEGTTLVKDIRSGGAASWPRDLLFLNGRMFFTADDGIHGEELWVSDGTENGTYLVADILQGATGSAPAELTTVGNTLYFSADDGIHGRELWKVVVEDDEPPPPPAGPEFRVNTFTAGDQRGFPTSPGQIAMAGDGSFVVTWTSVGQEGTGDEIYFQRYSARGTPVGGEVRANAIAAGNQRNSTIAAAADGSFVVAWNDDHVAANNFDIYARRFDAQGVPLGEEFLVNALNVAGAQRSPVVAASPDGRFAVVWHGPDASSNGIFARLYASDGTPLSDEFPVNTHATGQQQIKSAAMSAEGALMVVWQSDGQDGDAGGVYARIFEDDGTPRTNEFLAPQTSAGSQQNPSVAVDQAGNFLVTWTSDGQDGDAGGIYARRFNPDGEPQGDEFRVNETTASAQRYSTVAMDAEGDALITWSSLAQDGDGYGIYARRYNSAGQPEGHEFRVNTFTAGNQIYSSPALDADGDFVVVWSSQGQDGDVYGVYGQRYAVPRPAQPGDTDADGDVDLEDLNNVRNHFGEIGDGAPGDTSPFDGDVDLDDLNAVRNNFGATSSLSSELLAKRFAPTRALVRGELVWASHSNATRPAETLRSDQMEAAFDHVHAYAAGVWQRCKEALTDLEVEAPWRLAIAPHARRSAKR